MKAALSLAFALAVCTAAFATEPAAEAAQPQSEPENRFAASVAPAERFEAGSLLVERHGERRTPLILILRSGLKAGVSTGVSIR